MARGVHTLEGPLATLMRLLHDRGGSLARALGIPSDRLTEELNDDIKRMLGSVEVRLQAQEPHVPFASVEFRVFSQFGEDGIIQHLLRHVAVDNDFFVEIGVESYRESNTRFLLQHCNWEGVIIDSGVEHIRFLEESNLRWRHSVDPISAFVEPDTVNRLLSEAGVPQSPGLLSLDIDGVDYWVLMELDRRPAVVIAEYNSHFGCEAAVTVPYARGFDRTRAHFSNLYFGASLGAINHWASLRGYRLVGCSSGGTNAFFVREDLAPAIRRVPVQQAYVRTRVREAKDRSGRLTYRVEDAMQDLTLRRLPLVDLKSGNWLTVSDVVA